MRTASANEKRHYICNVFSHWLRPFSRDLILRVDNEPNFVLGGYFRSHPYQTHLLHQHTLERVCTPFCQHCHFSIPHFTIKMLSAIKMLRKNDDLDVHRTQYLRYNETFRVTFNINRHTKTIPNGNCSLMTPVTHYMQGFRVYTWNLLKTPYCFNIDSSDPITPQCANVTTFKSWMLFYITKFW